LAVNVILCSNSPSPPVLRTKHDKRKRARSNQICLRHNLLEKSACYQYAFTGKCVERQATPDLAARDYNQRVHNAVVTRIVEYPEAANTNEIVVIFSAEGK
jgi:hypothetical protein